MITPYYNTKASDFRLYLGESVEKLKQMEGQFDMIFSDPPYFLSTGNGKSNVLQTVSNRKDVMICPANPNCSFVF